jgi:sugar/nucleoside kinase (ribokinase family)
MTGAGDAFAASFVSAILYGKTIKQALKWGVINANNQIKEIGAIKGLLDKELQSRSWQIIYEINFRNFKTSK